MRDAGTQLRPMSAALIPPKGILLGAIDPANMLLGLNTQKRNPAKRRADARYILPAARAAIENS